MQKKNKKTEVNYNPTLQFRPGPAMGRRVAEFAERWRVSWNEATRRLAALGACGLTPKYSLVVERLAEYLGGVNEYFQAADRAQIVLQSADITRSSLQQHPMIEAERLAYLEDWITKFVAGEGTDFPADTAQVDEAQAAPNDQPTEEGYRRIRRNPDGDEESPGKDAEIKGGSGREDTHQPSDITHPGTETGEQQ